VGSALVSVHKRIFLAEVFVRVGVGVFVRVTMVVSMPGGVRMAVVRVRMAVVRVGERVLMAVLVTVTVS